MIHTEIPMQASLRLAASPIENGFILTALHEYTDPDGNPLYWRIRLKHHDGRKWVRPMRLDAGRYVLSEPKFPTEGKPLYRLHELIARPDDLVHIAEGENKADALSKLGLLATTSGAADSANKSHWKSIAERNVIIWPDFDDAGQRYAEVVAEKLLALNCKVSVIDVSLLGLPVKGDAINWLAAHPDASAKDIQQLTRKPINTQADVWPDPKPIDSELLPVEPFDADALLPDSLKAWIMSAANRMPCPPDFIAAAAIVALGSVIGARCVIKPKRFDDWAIVPNLWGGIVGLPSAKKTPAMNAALKPMDYLIAKALQRFKEDSTAFNAGKVIRDVRKDVLKDQLKKAAKEEANQEKENDNE
jgi:5S rRNA maturation endonuclease (ribonuclease M5)